jgi:hypothetical protein
MRNLSTVQRVLIVFILVLVLILLWRAVIG